jgi:hypothetical protein
MIKQIVLVSLHFELQRHTLVRPIWNQFGEMAFDDYTFLFQNLYAS